MIEILKKTTENNLMAQFTNFFYIKNAENGKICIFCSQSSLYRDFFPQGEEKIGSLKREFVISGVRYIESSLQL